MYWLPCSVLRDCILQVPLMSEGFSCHGLRVGESNYPRINVRCKVGENTHQSNVLANEVDDRSGRSISLFYQELVVVNRLLVSLNQGTLLPLIFFRFIRPRRSQ